LAGRIGVFLTTLASVLRMGEERCVICDMCGKRRIAAEPVPISAEEAN
jgi:hypothetical protein